MELTGSPVSLLEGVLVRASFNGEFTIAGDGTLVYMGGQTVGGDLTLVDSGGSGMVLLPNQIDAQAPRFSPDGSLIAFTAAPEGSSEVYILNRNLKTMSRLTFEGTALYPTWSAGGDTIYYSTEADRPDRDIWRRAADGSGEPERVLERPGEQYEIAIPRAGGVAVLREVLATGPDLYSLPLAPVGEPRPWVVTEFAERAPSLSPDARWAAYQSNESGQDEIYVRAFPEAKGRWQISSGGGTEPLWSRDGRTIYYRRADTLFATEVRTSPTFAVSQSHQLLTFRFSRFQSLENHTNYDRDPITGGFAVMVDSEGSTTSLVLVLNSFEEMKQRLSGAR